MKKSVLFLAALVAVSSAVTAQAKSVAYTPGLTHSSLKLTAQRQNAPQREGEEQTPSVDFTYAEDFANMYKLDASSGNNVYVYLAFKMDKEDQIPYIGNAITGMKIISPYTSSGSNGITGAEMFVTDKSSGVPEGLSVLKFDKTGGKLFTGNLNEPYTITGEKDLYIGYRIKYNKDCYYMPVDEVPTDPSRMMASVVNGKTSGPSYSPYGDQIGALCLTCIISGDNLPNNFVKPIETDILGYYAPETEFEYNLTVKNFGLNEIQSLVVRTEITNGFSQDFSYTFPTSLASGETATITIPNISNPTEGMFDVSTSVVKVNDVDIENPVSLTSSYKSYSGGYPRRAVIEEFTGTTCGFCPRGIVMMEYLKTNYPEWIRIAVHNYSGDPLRVASYNAMVSHYFEGAPSAVTNRLYDTPVDGNNDSSYRPIYNAITVEPALAKVDLTYETAADDQSVTVTATTEFGVDTDNNKLQLAFVIVEDGLGPYNQSNYYSGGSYGPLNGWESLGKSVPTVYDDVARYLDGYPGIANSIPQVIEKETPYEFERTIPITAVKGEEFRVVALIVDPTTGEIINANQKNCGKSAVKTVNGEYLDIRVENGEILVNGATDINIYTLDGRKVAASNLTKGIYIVTADGVSRKVLVK